VVSELTKDTGSPEGPVFPAALAGHLAAWREAAREIFAEHLGVRSIGEPSSLYGPRRWEDSFSPMAWRASFVLFLPVDGRPVNHHMAATFAADGSGIWVDASNHRGVSLRMSNRWGWLEPNGVGVFREHVRLAADMIGLL
jgi:hypothetical protein